MYHEALAYKKSRIYAEILSEQPLKDMANRFAQHHKQHFDALQNYLGQPPVTAKGVTYDESYQYEPAGTFLPIFSPRKRIW